MQTVLIVDDRERMRVALAMTMRRYKCEADVASCPESAMKQIRDKAGAYEAVFVDQKLDGNDRAGLELLEGIKKEFPDLAVVLFTGAAKSVEEEALDKGANAYLPKEEFSEREIGNLFRLIRVTNELQRQRKHLDSKRQWLQQVINGIIDEIIVISPEGQILMFNQAKRESRKLTDETIGKDLGEVSPDCLPLFDKAKRSGKVEREDYQRTDVKGRERIFNLIVSPVKDENGHALFYVKVAREVTKARKTMQLIEQIQKMQGARAC